MADLCSITGRPAFCRRITGSLIHPCRVVLLAMLLAFINAATKADDVTSQTEKLQDLREHIRGIKAELRSMQGQRNDVQAALEKTEKEIGSVTADLHQLDADASLTQKKVQSLNIDRDTERQALANLRQTLMHDLRSAYSAGRQQRIKLLLNQQDPSMVGRMMAYHGYFTRARATRLQDLQATLSRIDGIERALVEQQAEIEQLQRLRRDKSVRLLSEQDKRRSILAQLQRDMRLKSGNLSAMQENEAQLQVLVKSLQQAMRIIPPDGGELGSLHHLKGKLQWPVAGRFTRRYGSTHTSAGLQSRGVLIASREGADIHAIANGRIAFADWLRGFGLLLIIDHGNGYMSLYGHNHSLYKEVGAWVKRGEIVAAAGSSGGQDQAGLYLELRKDGRPFNPAPWFAGQPLPLRSGRE